MRISGQRIVTPEGVFSGSVVVDGARIASVAPGRVTGDFEGDLILPGFIDTHVHGGGGAQFNTADPDEIRTAARFHAKGGTTSLLATTVSAPVDELVEALHAIGAVANDAPGPGAAIVLGVHLEGPFLSRKRPGAMDPETFLEPSSEAVDSLLAAGGPVRWMTFAPELPGANEMARRLTQAGVVCSVGHSDATYDQVAAAVRSGVAAATHTFNAMRPMHHREPGVAGAVLDLGEVSCELICDGIHVAPAAMRVAYRAKGPRLVRLVTDAMAGTGMPDGDYLLGSSRVHVQGGRALLAQNSNAIAGSTLTMAGGFRNAIEMLGAGVEDASMMASGNPARMLGLADRKGAIAPGLDADLVVLSDELEVVATMVAGEWVHGPMVT